MLKARILLKADASEAGEAWSDGQIAEELASLETARVLLARTLRNLILAAMSAYAAGVPLAACQDPLEDVIAALDRALDEIPWVPA